MSGVSSIIEVYCVSSQSVVGVSSNDVVRGGAMSLKFCDTVNM